MTTIAPCGGPHTGPRISATAANMVAAKIAQSIKALWGDTDPILPGNVTSDPTQAAFVEVTVKPIALPTILPASFFGGSNVLTVGAQAVAGFDQVVCDFTPIFICNPFETQGMTYRQATEA